MREEVYVQLQARTPDQPLHPAEVEECAERRLRVRGLEIEQEPAPGSIVELHWLEEGVMHRQPARVITSSHDDADRLSLLVEPTGEVTPAVLREAYRVSVRRVDIRATLAGRPATVIDISQSGLAIESDLDHRIGDVLEVRIVWTDFVAVGQVRVQSATETSGSQRRYGLQALGRDGELLQSLRTLSAELQTAHLGHRHRGGE